MTSEVRIFHESKSWWSVSSKYFVLCVASDRLSSIRPRDDHIVLEIKLPSTHLFRELAPSRTHFFSLFSSSSYKILDSQEHSQATQQADDFTRLFIAWRTWQDFLWNTKDVWIRDSRLADCSCVHWAIQKSSHGRSVMINRLNDILLIRDILILVSLIVRVFNDFNWIFEVR